MSRKNETGKIDKTVIDDAVASFCVKIIREPLTYFSEADCQQLLVEELRQIKPLQAWYPTLVHKGKGSKGRYSTPLIHREYGAGDATRIDVVILSPKDVAMINTPNLTIGKKYLRPLFAFELGTEKSVEAKAHLENDLKKLTQRNQVTGYIIHFYKDKTRAQAGTKRRLKTEEKIETIFKHVFEEKRVRESRIKILPILIRVGRNQERMTGKCEIYDGNRWEKINISRPERMKDVIRERLR